MNYLDRLKRLTKITSIEFRAAFMVLITITILIAFKVALSRFNTTDVLPRVKGINTKVIKKFGAFSVKVRAGMFIKNFPIFDIKKNEFHMDSIVWFEFNPDEITLEVVEKFSFDKGRIIQKSPPDIRVMGDKIFVKYNVLFRVKSDLNYHKFPFEDHQIAIMLSNDFVTPNEMYFMADNSSFQASPDIFPANWKLQDLNVEPGFLDLELDEQDKSKVSSSPKVLYTINVVKASIKKILVLFIPLFAAIFFSLFTFLMNLANSRGKFSLSISAMTALLGYRFVIDRIMPQVAYFTTTDEIYLLFLVLTFICVIFQLIFTRQYMIYIEEHKNFTQTARFPWQLINSLAFIFMSIVFVASTLYIIFK